MAYDNQLQDPSTIGVGGLSGLKGLNLQQQLALLNIYNFNPRKAAQEANIRQLTLPSTRFIDAEPYGGISRYDTEGLFHDAAIKNLADLDNIEDARARVLPAFDKIAAGIIKGGTLAATTFADGMVGTIFGLANSVGNIGRYEDEESLLKLILNILYDSSLTQQEKQDLINKLSEKPKGFMDAFINNPFSRLMNDINEGIEKVLPNYYTEQERNLPWYSPENIFSANFIGDKFLKNLGFTIGAAYSYKTMFGLGAKATGLKDLRLAFKGAVTTSSGRVLNTSEEIAKAYMSGDAFMDGVKLTEDLAKAAKEYKNIEWGLKTAGAVASASGEGRIEAVQNSKLWYDLESLRLADAYNNAINNIENKLALQHPDWFIYQTINTDAGLQMVRLLRPEYLQEWEKEKALLDLKYTQGLALLAESRANMANNIYIENVALLSASNLWLFGNFVAGGYKSGRIAKNLVKGDLKAAARKPEDELFKALTANKNLANWLLFKSLSSPVMEALEEMSLAWISESAGLYEGSKLNNFWGSKIDPDAELLTIGYMNAVSQGFAATYGNLDRWEEGALGFLTGFMGIPSISFNRNDLGKMRPNIKFEGELWQGLGEYRNLKQEANSITELLNNRLLLDDFLNYYHGAIRHLATNNEMEEALNKGDKFGYENSSHKQFISDAIMFDKAGRLNDLYDIIEEASNVDEEDVKEIRELTTDKSTGKGLFDDKTDELVIEHIKKQGEEAKEKLDKYVEISNNLKTLYGENISSDALEEFTWMLTQVDNWESRSKLLLQELRETLQNKADEIKIVTGEDINILLNNFDNFGDAFFKDKDLIDELSSIINNRNASEDEKVERAKKIILRVLGRRGWNRRKFNETIKKIDLLLNDLILENMMVEDLNEEALNLFEEELKAETFKQRMAIGKKFSSQMKLAKQLLKELPLQIDNLFEEATTGVKKSERNKAKKQLQETIDFLLLAEQTVIQLDLGEEKRLELLLAKLLLLDNLDYINTLRIEELLRARDKLWEDSIAAKELQDEAKKWFLESEAILLQRILNLQDAIKSHSSAFNRLSPLETKELSLKIFDLTKLYTMRAKFISDYYKLANNPELFTLEMQETQKLIEDKYAEKEIQENLANYLNIKNIQDLRLLLSLTRKGLRHTILEKLKEDKNLAPIVKAHEEIQLTYNNISEISTELLILGTSVHDVIIDIINDALSKKEVIDNLKLLAENSPEDSDIRKLVERLNEIEKTSKIKDKDKTKTDKKADNGKKKSKSKSNEEDDEDVSAEQFGGIDAKNVFGKDKNDDTNLDEDDEDNEDNDSKKPSEQLLKLRKTITSGQSSISKKEIEELPETNEQADKDRNKLFVFIVPEEFEEDDDTVTKPVWKAVRAKDEDDARNILIDDYGFDEDEIEQIDISDFFINELSDKELKDISSTLNEIDFDKLDNEEQKAIKELAKQVLLFRKNPSAGIDDNTGGNYDVDEDENDSELENKPSRVLAYFKSWVYTKWNYKKLQDRDERKLELNDNPIVQRMDELGAYDFIDKGYLARLYKDNPDLEITYIIDGHPSLVSTLRELPFIMLAIKVDKNAKSVVGDKNAFNKAFLGSDGNTYLTIGLLGYPGGDTNLLESSKRKAYANIMSVTESILEEYDKAGLPENFVSSWSNKILKIDSGRFIKSDSNNDVEIRPLKEIKGLDKHPIIGVYYGVGNYKIPALSREYEEIVDLNANNNNPRAGSVWLLTLEPDGKWYSKALSVRRFVKGDWDIFSDLFKDTPIANEIRDIIIDIINGSNSDYERAMAKLELLKYLYFEEDAGIFFKDDIISIKAFADDNSNNNIGEGLSLDEKVDAILKVLQSEEMNIRMQVDALLLADDNYIQSLLESDILTTDILYAHNVNASFELYLNDLKTHGADESFNTSSSELVNLHRRGINNTISSTTITLAGTRYSIKEDGKIYKGRTLVEDEEVISLVMLQSQIDNGDIEPQEGTNLYIGNYPDGTLFGIKGRKILNEEEVEQELLKALELQKKAKLRKVSKQADEEDLDTPTNEEEAEENEALAKLKALREARKKSLALVELDDNEKEGALVLYDIKESLESNPLSEGLQIEIFTSEGVKQNNSVYRIVKFTNTRYGLMVNLLNVNDGSKLTLKQSLIEDNFGSKYKRISTIKSDEETDDNIKKENTMNLVNQIDFNDIENMYNQDEINDGIDIEEFVERLKLNLKEKRDRLLADRILLYDETANALLDIIDRYYDSIQEEDDEEGDNEIKPNLPTSQIFGSGEEFNPDAFGEFSIDSLTGKKDALLVITEHFDELIKWMESKGYATRYSTPRDLYEDLNNFDIKSFELALDALEYIKSCIRPF